MSGTPTTVASSESLSAESPILPTHSETTLEPTSAITSGRAPVSAVTVVRSETSVPTISTASTSGSANPSTTFLVVPNTHAGAGEHPSLDGTFVSVIVSADSETTAERAKGDLERRFGQMFGILASDEFTCLNPGYWVVYAGPFSTAAESQDACWSDLGMRTASLCYGRRLSQDPSDREIVYPPTSTVKEPEPTVFTTTASRQSELSASGVYRLVAPSIAFIVNGDGSGRGSGILVEGGYLVTNHRVVEPHRSVSRIVFPDGTEFWNVPIVGWSQEADLAVLGPVDTHIRALNLDDGEGMLPGSSLFLVGYPAEVERYPQPSVTQGILSRSYEEWGTDLTVFRTDAAAVGGQSGGAMVTAQGDVVGVTMRIITSRVSDQPVFTEAYSAADYSPLVSRILQAANSVPETTTSTRASTRSQSEAVRVLDGRFVSVVESTTSETAAEVARDVLENRFGIQFRIIVSGDFESLNPGYWVVYAGPFATAKESQTMCWSALNMRSASHCYGRRLSQDPADREIVYPPAAG